MHEIDTEIGGNPTRPEPDREKSRNGALTTWTQQARLIDWFRFVLVPIAGFLISAIIGPLIIAWAKKSWPEYFG